MAALERFTTARSDGGYLDKDDFIKFIRDAESGVAEKGWFEVRGPVAVLLIVLAGGLGTEPDAVCACR